MIYYCSLLYFNENCVSYNMFLFDLTSLKDQCSDNYNWKWSLIDFFIKFGVRLFLTSTSVHFNTIGGNALSTRKLEIGIIINEQHDAKNRGISFVENPSMIFFHFSIAPILCSLKDCIVQALSIIWNSSGRSPCPTDISLKVLQLFRNRWLVISSLIIAWRHSEG